jgi:hypothetical protein
MKLKIISIMAICLFLSGGKEFAQTDLPKSNNGDYQLITLFNAVNKADTGYTAVYKVPFNITQMIFEGVADTVTASDSLIIIIQGSPTGTTTGPWFTQGTWRCGTLGEANRQIISVADRYIRVAYQCKGSAIANDFRCYLTPKN